MWWKLYSNCMATNKPRTRDDVYEKAELLEDNRYGFGDSPAIVVIDLQNGETDPDHPMGSDLSSVIENTNEVVDVAHETDVPVIWVRVMFRHAAEADASLWTEKLPTIKNWKEGSYWAEYDERCNIGDNDHRLDKQHASCFAGTELNAMLNSMDVDTVIVCGCSTSACVRSTSDDASSLGYRVILPEECVGDRSDDQHESHLWEIDRKFGDVESLDTVKQNLREL